MAAGAGARARARLCVRAPPECSPRAWRPRLCPGARPARGGRAWSRRVVSEQEPGGPRAGLNQEWRHRWMCCPGQHLWSMLMMKNIRKWRQREIMKPVQDYNTGCNARVELKHHLRLEYGLAPLPTLSVTVDQVHVSQAE
ncbi:uncharacterized protein LOC144373238 isoform X11 [Ictidomys tridecemlineatus]